MLLSWVDSNHSLSYRHSTCPVPEQLISLAPCDLGLAGGARRARGDHPSCHWAWRLWSCVSGQLNCACTAAHPWRCCSADGIELRWTSNSYHCATAGSRTFSSACSCHGTWFWHLNAPGTLHSNQTSQGMQRQTLMLLLSRVQGTWRGLTVAVKTLTFTGNQCEERLPVRHVLCMWPTVVARPPANVLCTKLYILLCLHMPY
jgi:hypothetical protein